MGTPAYHRWNSKSSYTLHYTENGMEGRDTHRMSPRCLSKQTHYARMTRNANAEYHTENREETAGDGALAAIFKSINRYTTCVNMR